MLCMDFSGFAYEIFTCPAFNGFPTTRKRERRDLDLHQDANGLLVAAITLVVDLNKRTQRGTALHLPQALSLSHF